MFESSFCYLLQQSKKVEDAKLARDFQTTLQEFQKVQQLASERESTYMPSGPPPYAQARYSMRRKSIHVSFVLESLTKPLLFLLS